MMTRTITSKLLDMVDMNMLTWEVLALSCLNYMSESDVADMAVCEQLIDDEGDDDQDETGE